MSRSKTY